MKYKISTGTFLCIFIILVSNWLSIEAQTCNPSGRIVGKQPPPGQCNHENQSDCCKRGKLYTTYKCSPQVSQRTKVTLTINSFEKGGDGGGPSECDNKYHPDNTPVVAVWHSQQGGSARGKSAWTTLLSMVMLSEEPTLQNGAVYRHSKMVPCHVSDTLRHAPTHISAASVDFDFLTF